MARPPLLQAEDDIDRLLVVDDRQWKSTPGLRTLARRLLRKMPVGVDAGRVRALYRQVERFEPFPLFSAAMPTVYFPIYARLRLEEAQQAYESDTQPEFVSETAYLFACGGCEQMESFPHVAFEAADAQKFVARARLVETHRRFARSEDFTRPRFEAIACEKELLAAARLTLGNEWFLARCEEVEKGVHAEPRFDAKLWAACKYVLRVAGERAVAPGPEPPPV